VRYRGLAYVWVGAGFYEGANGLRQDKSAAVGSAHVVGLLHIFCQPAYTPCRLHTQESQQYQGLERRRVDRGFLP
jgi:hypothetical protein